MRTYEGGATDTGRVRRRNEDYCQWRLPSSPAEATRGALYAVADGVGGETAGEAASRLAVETLLRTYYLASADDAASSLRQAVARANAAVHQSGRHDGRATTLVAAAVVGDLLHVANVGDSRLYLVRDDAITQITHDHSWVQEQVRAGYLQPAEARRHPRGNVITRWLGQAQVEADLFSLELEPDDRIVLCTDGLVRHVDEETIRKVVQGYPEQLAADQLVRLANEAGGTDNVTVVVVRVAGESAQPAPPSRSPAPQAQARARCRPSYLVWPLLALLILGLAAVGALVVLESADGTASLTGSPAALAVGPDGTVYVADQAAGEVLAFPPSALAEPTVRLLGSRLNPAARWSAGEPDTPPASLTGLAVGPDGTVFVADGGSNRIRAFDSQGRLRAAWGASGSEPGRLNRPTGLAVDWAGQVYVADTGNHRVQRFDATGRFQKAWSEDGAAEGGLQEAVGVAVDAQGNVYVAEAGAGRVLRFDREGSLSETWGSSEPGRLARPQGLAIGPSGSLYVADSGLRLVRQLAAGQQPDQTWHALWPARIGFQEPTAVGVDLQGNLYVLDPRGGGVHVLRPRQSLWR